MQFDRENKSKQLEMEVNILIASCQLLLLFAGKLALIDYGPFSRFVLAQK